MTKCSVDSWFWLFRHVLGSRVPLGGSRTRGLVVVSLRRVRIVFVVVFSLVASVLSGFPETVAVSAQESEPPVVAVDDVVWTEVNGPVDVDVTDNDSDDSDDAVVAVTVAAESSGSAEVVVVEDEPIVVFTPDAGFDGVGGFSYEACVDGACSLADVTVYVGTSACTIVGTDGPDTLTGTAGDDIICALRGADVVNAGDGDDLVFGGRGADTLNGGAGADVLRGSRGDDVLSGGDGPDVLHGGPGADDLSGNRGADTLYGGRGPDTLKGGRGQDVLIGKAGADTLSGGNGADVLRGWRGDDVLSGGAGNDELYGGRDTDVLNGGDGNDLLKGKRGADTLNGDAGDDDLRGNRGNDILDGGEGIDTVNGGNGTDECSNGETTSECENEPIPELTVISPSDGAVVYSSLIVETISAGLAGGELVVRVDGAEVGRFPTGETVTSIDFGDRSAGAHTVSVELEAAGVVHVFETLEVSREVLSTSSDPIEQVDALQTAYDAGAISGDEYALNMVPQLAALEPTEPLTADAVEELTLGVFTAAATAWPDMTDQARRQLIAIDTLFVEEAGAQRALAPGCAENRITWEIGLIGPAATYCLFQFDPALAVGLGLPSHEYTPVDFWVHPRVLAGEFDRFDETPDSRVTGAPVELVEGAIRIWQAQRLFEDRGLRLPDANRGDGAQLSVVVTDDGKGAYGSAYSSPFSENQYFGIPDFLGFAGLGHPIRVSGERGHLRRTIIHELFHTYEWDSIDWAGEDVLGSFHMLETVAFFESAANWGTHEYSVEHAENWAYNANKAAESWFGLPERRFLSGARNAAKPSQAAYAYFPGLVWLDEQAGSDQPPAGAVSNDQSTSLVVNALLNFDRGLGIFQTSPDPVELIEEQIQAGPLAASGSEPYAVAWPRMWLAMYLMTNGPLEQPTNGITFFDEFGWTQYWHSEARFWRTSLTDRWATDGFGPAARRIRRIPQSPADTLGPDNAIESVSTVALNPGGAAFLDVSPQVPALSSATIEVTVSPTDASRSDKIESGIVQYAATGHPDICLRSGEPAIKMSDGERLPDGSLRFLVDVDDECPTFTVAVVQVDPNSGTPSDAFSIELKYIPGESTVEVTTESLEDGESGTVYGPIALTASVDAAWNVSGGALPQQMTLTPEGALGGTPNGGGFYQFSVTATSASGATGSRDLNLVINGPELSDDASHQITIGETFDQNVSVDTFYPEFAPSNPARPTVQSYAIADGQMPDGWSLDVATGVITGTPTTLGVVRLEITALDSAGNFSTTAHEFVVVELEGFLDFETADLIGQGKVVDMETDASGNVYVVSDNRSVPFEADTVQLFKLDPAGNILWSVANFSDPVYDPKVKVGPGGDAWMTAFTGNDSGQATVWRFDADGNTLWSTSFGGTSEREWCSELAVDGSGNSYCGGRTESDDWISPAVASGALSADAFVTKLDPDGLILWSVAFTDEPISEYDSPGEVEALAVSGDKVFAVVGGDGLNDGIDVINATRLVILDSDSGSKLSSQQLDPFQYELGGFTWSNIVRYNDFKISEDGSKLWLVAGYTPQRAADGSTPPDKPIAWAFDSDGTILSRIETDPNSGAEAKFVNVEEADSGRIYLTLAKRPRFTREEPGGPIAEIGVTGVEFLSFDALLGDRQYEGGFTSGDIQRAVFASSPTTFWFGNHVRTPGTIISVASVTRQ